VIINNGCVATGMNELEGDHSTHAYPNPTPDALTITSDLKLQKIELTSSTGQVLLSETTSGKHHQLQLSELAPGIYFISVYSDGHVIKREKIVVQR
jgi:type IX secretion system substrate protein